MKQLTCEMCGSNDLLKQNGIFVCQTCGTKYSVGEAKKMMIEGVVEVTGSVKVDKSPELENLLIISERAVNEGNYEIAESFYEKILIIDPDNWKANFYRSYCATMHCKIINLDNSFNTTLTTATSTIRMIIANDEVDIEAIIEIMKRISSLAKMVIYNKFEIYKKFPERCFIDNYGYPTHTQNKDAFVKYTLECTKMISDLSLFYTVILDSPYATLHMVDIADALHDTIKNHMLNFSHYYPYYDTKPFKRYTEIAAKAATNCGSVLGAFETTNKEIRERIERQQKEVEKKKRKEEEERKRAEEKERFDAYWAEHTEEKQQLESELSRLQTEVKDHKAQLTPLEHEIEDINSAYKLDCYEVPAKIEQQSVIREIAKLRSELRNLGLFKGKEKKVIQAQIDELDSRLPEIKKSIDLEIGELRKELNEKINALENKAKPLKAKIFSAEKRISEIKAELTKNR